MIFVVLEPGPQGPQPPQWPLINQTTIGKLLCHRFNVTQSLDFPWCSACLANFFSGFPGVAIFKRPHKWTFLRMSWPIALQKYQLWGCTTTQSASKQHSKRYICIWMLPRSSTGWETYFPQNITEISNCDISRTRRSYELCSGYVAAMSLLFGFWDLLYATMTLNQCYR